MGSKGTAGSALPKSCNQRYLGNERRQHCVLKDCSDLCRPYWLSLIQEEFRAGRALGKGFGIEKTPGILLNGTFITD